MPDPRHHNQSQPDREPLVQYEDLEQATGFTQISNAVLRCYPELSDGEKMTYAVLKSFAYVGPETFVGEETLARARSVTISTISRHLSRLVEVGLVKVRRRGQGKTNIWIITRIPRDKLEEYIDQWRPNLTVHKRKSRRSSAAPKGPPQNAQTQTSQNAQVKEAQEPQVKNQRNPQAEEEKPEEEEKEPQGRGNRPGNGSLSTGDNTSMTTATSAGIGANSLEGGVVENPGGSQQGFSTGVETVENLAQMVAEQFQVPAQEEKIAHCRRRRLRTTSPSMTRTWCRRPSRRSQRAWSTATLSASPSPTSTRSCGSHRPSTMRARRIAGAMTASAA